MSTGLGSGTKMPSQYEPLHYFAGVFVLTSLAGLAAMYRAGKIPEKSRVFAASLTSGLLGVAIAMYGWEHYPQSPWTCAAISLLAGIGGMSTVDFVVTAMKSAAQAFLNSKLPRDRDDK